jgi:hypothetical protein
MKPKQRTPTDQRRKRSIEHFLTGLLLKTSLKTLGLAFLLSKSYRRNLDGFHGKYLFRTRDNLVHIAAVFDHGKLKVYEEAITDADIAINFRDPKTLRVYLSSPNPDILDSILKQDVTIDGNLNYLYKLTYMIRHLQLRLLRQI